MKKGGDTIVKKAIVASLIVASLLVVMTISVNAQEKNTEAWIPGIASFLIPGLGQLLNDELDKAIVHFVVDIAIIAGGGYLAWMAYDPYQLFSNARFALLGLAHFAWSLYSGYDAYTVAKETGFSIGLSKDGIALSYQYQI